jgi:hypothetical protein
MVTFSQLPGSLHLQFIQGDTLNVEIDFEASLVNYTVSATLFSTVSSQTILAMTTEVSSESDGIVVVSLTAVQTASIPVGTYAWQLVWTSPSGVVRKALSGFVEVRRR